MLTSVCSFACFSVNKKVLKQFSPCGIKDYCYGRNSLNFTVDPTQNGRLTAILDSG